jgi:hypothetical protein
MHIEELLREMEKLERTKDHGRGLESLNVARCPTCDQATVLIEHEYTPQLRLSLSDDEPQREGTYFTCEWCNSEIDTTYMPLPSMPRKPAVSAGWEPEDEWARRRA